MLKCKTANPKWIIIIVIIVLSIIIFNNNITRTFCEEEYQIAQCPDNLYLSSYYIKAENSESAISEIKNILLNNNFNLDDYEIIIENNIIKILEKEKQKTEETTTIQNNNLEIENESVEFNENNNNAPEKIITNGFQIIKCPEKLKELEGKYIREIPEGYNDLIEKVKNKINETGENADNYIIKIKYGNKVVTEENYDEIIGTYNIQYIGVNIEEKEQTSETTETTESTETTTEEGGGKLNDKDIKEFKEIGICICVLLAISLLYNFASALFRRL